MSEVQILSPRPILTDTKGRQSASCEIRCAKRRFLTGMGEFLHQLFVFVRQKHSQFLCAIGGFNQPIIHDTAARSSNSLVDWLGRNTMKWLDGCIVRSILDDYAPAELTADAPWNGHIERRWIRWTELLKCQHGRPPQERAFSRLGRTGVASALSCRTRRCAELPSRQRSPRHHRLQDTGALLWRKPVRG